MKLKNSDITLLCKVVDNYGDIGVVFRLAKALSMLMPEGGAGLRLIVDNLEAFAQLSPGVDTSKHIQEHRGWKVCQWDAADEGRKMYEETPPLVIVECFACGRPEWLDDILFDKSLQALRPKPVQIINLEYLTAEPYADEFHKLQSLTRSAQVRKVNFMPGFTDKTGGLILDGAPVVCGSWFSTKDTPTRTSTDLAGGVAPVVCGSSFSADDRKKPFTVLVFSYERDFSTIADALATFAVNGSSLTATGASASAKSAVCTRNTAHTASGNLRILVAAGKADAPFSSAWNMCVKRENLSENAHPQCANCQKPNGSLPEPEKLPFMPQDKWDETLYNADFIFIRGEDSLSRACLSAKPFVWHAYPQSEMYHLVKVKALLDRMEPFFSAENFRLIRDYWLWYNGDEFFAPNATQQQAQKAASSGDTNGTQNTASVQNTTGICTRTNENSATTNGIYDSRAALIKILSHYDEMAESFRAFSKNLVKNGNLAEHLMTFIEEIV